MNDFWTSQKSSLPDPLSIDWGLYSGDLQFVPMYYFPAKIQCPEYKATDRY